MRRFLFFCSLFVLFSLSSFALDVSDEITQAYIRFDSGAWQSVHSNLSADVLTYNDTFQVSNSIDILIPVSVPTDSVVARFDFLTRSASFGSFSVDYGTFYDSVYRPRTDPLQYTFVNANRLDYSGGSHLFSRSVQVFCNSMSTTNVYWFIGFHWFGSKVTLVTTQSIGNVVASASSTDSIALSGDWASIPASSSFSGSSPISLSPSGSFKFAPDSYSSVVGIKSNENGAGFGSTAIFRQTGEYFYLTTFGHQLLMTGYTGTVYNVSYTSSSLPDYSGNIDLSGTLPNYNNSATVSGDSPDYSVSGKVQSVNSVYPFSFTASRASDDSEAVAQLKRANATLDVMDKNLQTITDDYTAREDAGTEIGGTASDNDVSSGASGMSSGLSAIQSGISGLPDFSSIMAPATAYISFLTVPVSAIFSFGNGYLLYIAMAMVILSVVFAVIRHLGGGSDD